ncbi:MAG: L,D-transpeptidase [Phycisphaerales bacterium]|jgi:lipoprotein-anchoring transpeptidase ErfK/SrfK|nr:L,D-transpeptidase [Phycisphaerales bacterium]
MRKNTLHYIIGGGVVLLVVAGVIIANRPGPASEPAPVAPVEQGGQVTLAPPVPLSEPLANPTENYQMNPPEAGFNDPQKPQAPVSAKAPVRNVWLKPARVSSKNTPLGPLTAPSILVEKSALRLTVFDGDAGVKSYRIAAGAVRGDKNVEGDRKTPEGDFYICIRKTAGQTPYTRSMGLSYPNAEDAARGLRNGLITASQYNSIVSAIKNKRKPPWQTKLGGAIMIHGKRESRTGTLGCVALDDADVLELYKRLPLNTPVRIIP